MRHPPWIATGMLALALVGPPASAQAAGPVPAPAAAPAATALAAAVDAAWQRAVAARETQAQGRLALSRQALSERPWSAPPALEIGQRAGQGAARGDRETEIAIAWPLWLPGQRRAQAEATGAEAAVAEAAAAAARLQVAGEVREAAWALAARAAEAAQAAEAEATLRQLADDVARRVAAGDLAPADDLAARAEHLAAQAALAEQRQHLAAAGLRWTALTGLPAPAAAAGLDETAGPADAPGAARAPDPAWAERHPELQLAQRALDLARQQLALAQASRRDAPELSLGWRQDRPGSGAAGANSIGLSLRLPFGGDERNAPLQAAAAGALDVAQTRAERLRDRLQADAETARGAVQAAQLQRDASRQAAALLQERAALIDRSFRAGETALPELLRALSAATQARGTAARHQTALGLAHARLNQALGAMP